MADASQSQFEQAREIISRLRRHGHSAYLVGGCVRDLLLGFPPKDLDVATSARPDDIQQLFPRGQHVGVHFGVMMVDGVEVATFRSDHQYLDGRRPVQVVFETDPRQDVLRRDFTINALLMDPDQGEVLDFVGGREDIERRVIRAVGDAGRRFAEDHLRMLRGIRFAARLGFRMDPATEDAIRALAPKVRLVSAERIRMELDRILVEGDPRRGFELLDETCLLNEVLPEVSAMKGVEQPPEFHPEGDVWTHTLLMLGMMRKPTLSLAWGVLLHDVAKPPTFRIAGRIRFDGHAELGATMAGEILSRLRCSNEVIQRVHALVAHHLRFKDVRRMRESTLKRFLRMDGFDEHLELHRLDCASSHRLFDNYEFVREKLAAIPPAELKPPRLLGGEDLKARGFVPGPAFRVILDAVETAQLEGQVSTREQALELVLERFEPPDGRVRHVESA
jgi:poly(A) polymerase